MQAQEFNKFFSEEDFNKAMMVDTSKFSAQEKLELNSLIEHHPEEARKLIEKKQVLIPNDLSVKIRRFVVRKRKEKVSDERIARMIKKVFKITVV